MSSSCETPTEGYSFCYFWRWSKKDKEVVCVSILSVVIVISVNPLIQRAVRKLPRAVEVVRFGAGPVMPTWSWACSASLPQLLQNKDSVLFGRDLKIHREDTAKFVHDRLPSFSVLSAFLPIQLPRFDIKSAPFPWHMPLSNNDA